MNVNMNSVTGFPTETLFPNGIHFNPILLTLIIVILILYYFVFKVFGKKSQNQSSTPSAPGKSISILEILLWGTFIVLLILNGVNYFFNMDITASIQNLFSDNPEIDLIVDPDDLAGDSESIPPVPEIKLKKQVFYVPENKYTYPNAKAICRAYGGRLATWKELSKAYKKGADWCGMGWSDGQMALYPTQYDKWVKLQDIEGHENDCGRPGINGGYIDNPNVKFGINCYGYKPKITQDEAKAMQTAPLYPKTEREILFDKRVDYWKGKLPNVEVAPFNHNNWSSI